MEITDITIVGGGPAGLFAAFYAGLRGTSVKIIESLPQLGGQLSALYPDKWIYDVAGFPKIIAQDLVNRLVQQADRFHPQYFLNEKVIQITKKEERLFEIVTTKQTHYSKAIIITAGMGAFEPRKLPIPEAEKYEKTNLHYYVTNHSLFRNKNVLIAGGGDSAVDWALLLEPIANIVTLIHRRDKFRAHEQSVNQLMQSNVKVITPREILALEGDEKITHVVIGDKKTGEKETLAVDEVIVSFGFVSDLQTMKKWGLELTDQGILVNSRMETNIPGIFAAGDVADYEGKLKLIAIGFGEAPIAVSHAKRYIDPNAKLYPGHSSNLNLD